MWQGRPGKTLRQSRSNQKTQSLLLNEVYTTVSERPILYLYHPIYTYILYKVWKRHTAERQWQNLFSPAPPLLSATHLILLIDHWPLTVAYWPLTVAPWPLPLDPWPLTLDPWPLTVDRWPLTVDRWPLTPWKKMKEICNRVFVSYEEGCTFARRLLSRRASKGLRLLVKRRQFYWPGTMSKKKARG